MAWLSALDVTCKEKKTYFCRKRWGCESKVVLKLKATHLNVNHYFLNHFITHNVFLNIVTLHLIRMYISTCVLWAAHYSFHASLSMCGMPLEWIRFKLTLISPAGKWGHFSKPCDPRSWKGSQLGGSHVFAELYVHFWGNKKWWAKYLYLRHDLHFCRCFLR